MTFRTAKRAGFPAVAHTSGSRKDEVTDLWDIVDDQDYQDMVKGRPADNLATGEKAEILLF